jgi:hypothetical protein
MGYHVDHNASGSYYLIVSFGKLNDSICSTFHVAQSFIFCALIVDHCLSCRLFYFGYCIINPGIEKKNKTQSARFQHPIDNTEKQRQISILLTHIYDRTFSRLDTDTSIKDDRVKLTSVYTINYW